MCAVTARRDFWPATPSATVQPSAVAVDLVDFMDALKIQKAILAGFDWGARTANIVAALWPDRCKAMVSVSGYLIGSQEPERCRCPRKPSSNGGISSTSRPTAGRAGYDKYRKEFSRLIWQLASPKWRFDDAAFERSAAAFDNPDHVAIVIHNYRWRLALAEGEPRYADLDKRLAEFPVIGVPTITMEGDANGAPHLEPAAYAKKFSGKYAHRLVKGGVGHNLPQEAPQAFAQAVLDVIDSEGSDDKGRASRAMANEPLPASIATRQHQMFPTLSEADIARVRRYGTTRHFARGERLIAAGEVGPGMFVLLKGTVSVPPARRLGTCRDRSRRRARASSWRKSRSFQEDVRSSMVTRRRTSMRCSCRPSSCAR
jgi:pimeloyl-ACP methyl ester carboxylesterase